MNRHLQKSRWMGISLPMFVILCHFSNLPDARGAEGLRLLPESAEALGKAGGKFANLSDPSVVRFNPANLGLIDGSKFMMSTSLLHGATSYSSPNGNDKMESPWKYSGGFYFATNVPDSPWAYGFGLSAPTGLDMKWDRDGVLARGGAAPYKALLFNSALSPAASYQINDCFSVGVGVDITFSYLELAQVYPAAIADSLKIKGDGWGFSPVVSFAWDVADRHRLAVIARAPMKVDYEGKADFTNNTAAIPNPRTKFESEIEFAGSVAVGYSFDISDDFRIGVDYEWIQNSTHDDLITDIGTNQPLLPRRTPLEWDDSWNLGFSLEKDVCEELTLRGGYMYSKSPMPDRTFHPAIPANDRHLITTGIGIKRECHSIDAAYALGIYEDRNITNNIQQPQPFNGHWEYLWHQFTVSYTYSF